MAEKIEGVYEIKIVQGPALRAFEGIKKRLDDTKGAIRDMNKETRRLVAEEQAINKAIGQTGQATEQQTAALGKNSKRREELNKQLSEAVLIERALSAQSRELSNNLSGLTEHGLRFRDKMADANKIALQQSGLIDELAKRHEQLSGAMGKVDAAMQDNAAQTTALNTALEEGKVTQAQYAQEQERLASELTDAKAAQKLLSDELAKSNAVTSKLDAAVSELNRQLASGAITSEQYAKGLKGIEEEARKGAEATGSLGEKFDQFVNDQGKGLQSALKGAVLGFIGVQVVLNKLTDTLSNARQAYLDHERASAAVQQTLKSTGEQAERTFAQLDKSAEKLAQNSLFGADEILEKSTTRLLTYTNIVGKTFDRAQQAAIDMATALGTDLASASETVGKALGSPLKAMGALSKQGYTFSAEQKQLIADLMATGRTAEAQAVILNELEEAYGGQASAAVEASHGTRELSAAMERFSLSLGRVITGGKGFNTWLAGVVSGISDMIDVLSGNDARSQSIDAFTARVQKQFEALGGSGVLVAKAGSERVERLRQITDNVLAQIDRVQEGGDKLDASLESYAFRQRLIEVQKEMAEAVASGNLVEQAAAKAAEQAIVEQLQRLQKVSVAVEATEETLGEKTARLTSALEEAKAARNLLAAADAEGIAAADKNIAALQQEIDALGGKAKATKGAAKADQEALQVAKDRQQVLDDIAAAEKERERAKLSPEKHELAQAADTMEERAAKARGDADLLLKIEEEYQTQKTEIERRYAAERFAARQQAEDNAAKFIADQRTAQAGAELQRLQQQQDKEMELAAQRGDDLTALMQRQQAEREALVQTLRDAEVQKINDTYEAQYAALDAAGASTLELQAQHGADLNALNEQFRLEDEANARAAVERRLQVLQQQQAIELGAAQDLGNALGELASGQLRDQKDVEKALLKILLKSVKAQIQMAIVAATAKEVGTKGFIGLGTAALLTGLLEGLFAGLGNVIEGFAKGGTVPDGRGTVRPAWGTPVRRSNGDNVMVTLRTGEKVLNKEQQRRLEAITSGGIWGAIGLPGHSMRDAMYMMRRGNSIAGYAEGGTVGIVTPRPSPQTIVQNQFVQAIGSVADRPMFVSVREINDVQGRVNVTETLGSL